MSYKLSYRFESRRDSDSSPETKPSITQGTPEEKARDMAAEIRRKVPPGGEVRMHITRDGLSGSESLECAVEEGGFSPDEVGGEVYADGREVGSSVGFEQWNSPWIPPIDQGK